ncbi:MAG: NUDIX domain-containing protein [Actinobacteria bacterium]|nr:NUDIX domain-containing protein [Actinomycetota bacterium]
MAGQHFRAGVEMVGRHPDGRRIMAFERSDAPGSWQLPQGGLDAAEEPVDAAWRELREETALGPDDVTLCAEHPDWVLYEWPVEIMREHGKDGRRRGQIHRWFVFDALEPDVEPRPDGSEFVAWQWVEPQWLLDHVPAWRRVAYERVLTGL